MVRTTFAEEIYLRALTGKVIGEQMVSEYAKVAFVSPKNIICCAISAAAEAAYLIRTGARAAHFIADPDNLDHMAQEIQRFLPEAVVLMFGGETPIEETKRLFLNTLRAFARAGLEADLVVHVRIFAAGGLQEAVKDPEILNYLSRNDLYVYTADLDRGLFLYNSLHIERDGSFHLHRIAEFPVTLEHADLLNRSLRNKTLKWVDL